MENKKRSFTERRPNKQELFQALYILHYFIDWEGLAEERAERRIVADLERYKQGLPLIDTDEDFKLFYDQLGGFEGEGEEALKKASKIVLHFLEYREEELRAAFVEYYTDCLLIAFSLGQCWGSWKKALDYGLDAALYPFPEGDTQELIEKPRYYSREELSSKDLEAVRKTAEDAAFEAYEVLVLHYIEEYQQGRRKAFTSGIIEYKKEGYTKREIEQYRFGNTDEELDFAISGWELDTELDETLSGWEFDMELVLPFCIFHLNTALHYAITYKGTEYKDYLLSLNPWEDWDEFIGEEYPQYKRAALTKEA